MLVDGTVLKFNQKSFAITTDLRSHVIFINVVNAAVSATLWMRYVIVLI